MIPPRARHPRDFESRVTQVLARIDAGEVLTYGEVAAEAGHPGAARAVGNLLARGDGLPWWRVVTSTGRLVPGYEEEQARHLAREGVAVYGGRIRLNAVTRRRTGQSTR